MDQKTDPTVEETVNELSATQRSAAGGLIVTTSSMVDFLLQAGIAGARIEEMTGSAPGFVKQGLNDDTIFDEKIASKEIKRLRILYLREGLKHYFRKYPFIGVKKSAGRLGITEKECSSIYDSLISSGELKFKMSRPNWEGADTKELLREHIVVR